MTPGDAARLLGIAAGVDRRTVSESEAHLWADALDGIDLAEAEAAVRKHYAETRDFVYPADVRRIVFATRAQRRTEDVRRFGPVTPPRALADDPRGEQEWVRSYRYLVGRGVERPQAISESCRRLGVPMDTAELVARPLVVKAIEAARATITRRTDEG